MLSFTFSQHLCIFLWRKTNDSCSTAAKTCSNALKTLKDCCRVQCRNLHDQSWYAIILHLIINLANRFKCPCNIVSTIAEEKAHEDHSIVKVKTIISSLQLLLYCDKEKGVWVQWLLTLVEEPLLLIQRNLLGAMCWLMQPPFGSCWERGKGSNESAKSMMHQICLKLNPYPLPFSAVYKWFQAYFETVQSHCSSWLSGYIFQITAGGITDCKDWSHPRSSSQGQKCYILQMMYPSWFQTWMQQCCRDSIAFYDSFQFGPMPGLAFLLNCLQMHTLLHLLELQFQTESSTFSKVLTWIGQGKAVHRL